MNLHVNLPEFEPSDSPTANLYFSQPLLLALAASIGLHVVFLWYLPAEGKQSASERARGISVKVTVESHPPASRQPPVFTDTPEAATTGTAPATAASAVTVSTTSASTTSASLTSASTTSEATTTAAKTSAVPGQPRATDSTSAVEATIPRDLSGYLQPADTHWSASTPVSPEISTGRERVIFDPRLKTRLGHTLPIGEHSQEREISFRAQDGSQSVQLDNGRCFSVRNNQQWGESAIWWHTTCGNKKYEMEFEYNPR